VQYYLHLNISGREKAVAVVSVYSPPHAGLLKLSHNTLWSSTYHGDAALTVVDVKKILAVVAMVPHQPLGADSVGRFFVVEKPGLDVAHMGGNDEVVSEE